MTLDWPSVRDLGDAAFIVTVVLGMSAAFWVNRGRRLAVVWVGALATAIALVTATKLAFFGWGIGIRALDFTGISGHSTLSAAVYPVFGKLFASRVTGAVPRRAVLGGAILCGAVLAVIISIASIAVGAHSPSEVIAGFILGGSVAALAIAQPSPVRHAPHTHLLIVVVACIAAVGAYGHRAEAGGGLMDLATRLSGAPHPFVRETWLLEGGAATH